MKHSVSEYRVTSHRFFVLLHALRHDRVQHSTAIVQRHGLGQFRSSACVRWFRAVDLWSALISSG